MKKKKICTMLLCLCMAAAWMPGNAFAAESKGVNTEQVSVCTLEDTTAFTFSDSEITVTEGIDTGYKISGTILTINSNGTYSVSGSCQEGSIVISKGLKEVTLILKDLTLTSSSTAPVIVKKSSEVCIHLEGTSTLTDNENPENETSSDEAVADAFEGAAIKVKSGSSITFCGEGNLNIAANAKNGIKAGSTSELIFNQSGTLSITGTGKYYGGTKSGAAANNGIACDGSIVFNQGNYIVKATNDGIKSTPDATDESGDTTIDTESAGTITINGGSFDIDVDGDGIQADTALVINGGTFDIQTWQGYNVWNDNLANNYSCKGLKASGDRAEEAEISPVINISGGTFTLNTGDDAIHSDADITVTGGIFTIDTGDDGIHADTTLVLGTENGFEQDPDVTINHSYEGLESGTVSIYSGRYYVIASDDGVNAAGGSANGSDMGFGGGNNFRPGPGGGNHGGWNPGGGNSSAGDYNIYVYGGDLYVNCSGDGLDSNGGLYLYGGHLAVFSMASGGDNSALDADGTILIQGATIFTAGTKGVDGTAQNSWFGTDQKYATSGTSYNSGKIISTKAGSNGEEIFSYVLPKNVNYIMASWPSSVSSSSPSISTASSVTSCKGGSWSHDWNSGESTTVTDSEPTEVITYTCSDCGKTETHTLPATVHIDPCTHFTDAETPVEKGFNVNFACDSGINRIDVYYTKDYTSADETDVRSTVSRDSDTGKPDDSGNGQVNFRIWMNDGYSLSSVTATSGTYKNIKTPDDTGVENMYRITKISNDTVITITTSKDTEHTHVYGSEWMKDDTEHWKECECGDKTEIAEHSFEWVIDKEASESEAGYKHEECTVCHVKRNENTEISVLPSEQNSVIRIYGTSRYETAYAAADTYKEILGIEKFDTVIVATGTNFADALSGSYLASVKNAPILLTNGKTDNAAMLCEYIVKNVTEGGKVYILGGTGAVSENVENSIKAAGYTVDRISGSTRYETSLKILTEAKITGNEIIIATGNNFADSLSASATGRPIMLVKPDTTLNDDQKAVLRDMNGATIYIVGGTGAVSAEIEEELAGYGEIVRLAGASRYETSVKVAETFFDDVTTAVAASGKNFPDGLCGGPLAAALGAPLILAKDGNTAAAAEYIAEQGIGSGYVLGGTGAISEETVKEVFVTVQTAANHMLICCVKE